MRWRNSRYVRFSRPSAGTSALRSSVTRRGSEHRGRGCGPTRGGPMSVRDDDRQELDGSIEWDDLHPATKDLLSRRRFIGRGATGIMLFGSIPVLLAACGSSDKKAAATTTTTAAAATATTAAE